MSPARITAILVLLASTLAIGCYQTSITVQGGAGTVPLDHDEAWHHGAVYGLVDFSSPHDLDKICPGGTVSLYSETTFVQGLVHGITFGLYNPQSVTITCTPGAAAPAAVDTEAPAATEATEPAPAEAAAPDPELPPAPPAEAPAAP